MWQIRGLPACHCCALGTKTDLAGAQNLMISCWEPCVHHNGGPFSPAERPERTTDIGLSED